jgi:hypothetical protein
MQGQEHEASSRVSGTDRKREIDMTKALVKTQIRLQQLVTKREGGQGTLEYIGMIVVAAILVVIVVAAVKDGKIKDALTTAITNITKG